LKGFIYLFLVLFTLTCLYFLFKNVQIQNSKLNSIASDWSFQIESVHTESCIKLIDIDEDGLDDIIFGVTVQNENQTGLVIGVSGYNGKILYKFPTKSEILFLNCLIDIDKDNKTDCIGIGKNKTFIAFNPRSGKLLWESNGHELIHSLDIYDSLILPYDFDDDGVNEFIISNRGLPSKDEPGMIMLYSGKSGILMGECLVLPNEIYVQPILHVLKNNASYLLFATGSKDKPGDLYIISLTDFFQHVMKEQLDSNTIKSINFKEDYSLKVSLAKKFKSLNYLPTLYSIFSSKLHGLTIPIVLVANKDNITNDILVITFDSNIVLFNGETFNIIWEKKFECYHTYSKPETAYFDQDNTLDFIFVLNHNNEISSKTMILNGKDGSLLYQIESSYSTEIISPLKITSNDNHDFYLIKVKGSSNQKTSFEIRNCSNKNDEIKFNCFNESLKTYDLLVDRSAVKNFPIIAFESNFNYTASKICIKPNSNTGIIGYLRSDKTSLDIITIRNNGNIFFLELNN